jgi:hypothetical protein
MPNQLHLLHTKSWHTGRAENVERVLRDEAAAREEAERAREAAESEAAAARLALLRARAAAARGDAPPADEAPRAEAPREEAPRSDGGARADAGREGKGLRVRDRGGEPKRGAGGAGAVAGDAAAPPSFAESVADTARPWYTSSSSSSSSSSAAVRAGAGAAGGDFERAARDARAAARKSALDPWTSVRSALQARKRQRGDGGDDFRGGSGGDDWRRRRAAGASRFGEQDARQQHPQQAHPVQALRPQSNAQPLQSEGLAALRAERLAREAFESAREQALLQQLAVRGGGPGASPSPSQSRGAGRWS